MAAGRRLRQFGLLLWKNWLLQKRKPVLTFFEVALPTLFALVLLLIRLRVEVTVYSAPTTWDAYTVDAFDPDLVPYGARLSPDAMSRMGAGALPAGGNAVPGPSGASVPGGGGLPALLQAMATKWQLAYTPDHPTAKAVMDKVAARLDLMLVGLKVNSTTEMMSLAFASEAAMLEHLAQEDLALLNVLGGVVFDGDLPADGSLPAHWTYRIRRRSEHYFGGGGFNPAASSSWFTDFVFPQGGFSLGPRAKNDTEGGTPGYYMEGFLSLQRALDLSIIELLNTTAATEQVAVALSRFPYPPYTEDAFTIVLSLQLPLIVLLSFMITAPSIAKDVVLEKERKLKESMKMMGLSNWLHWLAWFTKYIMFLLISVIIMTVFYHIKVKGRGVINYTDPSVTFVFLLMYAIAIIMFCFMMSGFFSKANSGATACGIIFFILYVPYFFLSGQYSSLNIVAKILSSLSLNVAMAYGCRQIADYEGSTIGLQWHNVGQAVTVDDDFSMAHVLVMLAVDAVLYGLITWYVDAVFPGDYGIPKPWYFFVTKTYWCGSGVNDTVTCENSVGNLENGEDAEFGPNSHMYETPPSNKTAGIQIRQLKKEFKGKSGMKKTAVDSISLDMYEGQITALLGHNGAGKTTTMFMLTGFIPPDGGNAVINGHDIRSNIDGVRSSLGLCPQHDVLFDSLTVHEHLTFFAKLKGLTGHAVETAVRDMIALLHLEKKTHAQSKSLSGGMKRKLSVGIALIGDSKVVILDEPTSGMDPEARRQTWDILQSQRAGRTMLLTTHFMDEADYLGDRIAIMAEGVVQCCGSSLYLKRKYGVGYHMTLVKTPKCDVANVTSIVTKHVPAASMEANVSAELSYILPHESSALFEGLFTELEQNMVSLGITSFGASVTTMEEVFLKVGESMDEDLQGRLQKGSVNPEGFENKAFQPDGANADGPAQTNGDNGTKAVFSSFGRNSGCGLYLQQFRAMLEKRVIYSMRNWKLSIAQLLIPVLFAALSCWVILTIGETTGTDPPPRPLNLSMFTDPITPHVAVLNSANSQGSRLRPVFVSVADNLSTTERVTDPAMTMEDYLIAKAAEDKDSYFRNYMTAGSIIDLSASNTTFMGWFNNEALHSPAVTLSLIGNSLLQYFTTSQYSISAANHPLPKLNSSKAQEELDLSATSGFIVAYNLTFAFAFLVATFVIFLIKERTAKAKHSQFVSGVHVLTFWASTFTWDVINYLVPSLLVIAVLAAFNIEGYVEDANAGFVLLIFVLYAWSVLPLAYLLSFLFSVPASGYTWLSTLNIILGTAAVITVQILAIPQLDLVEVGEALEWVFLCVFPNYCFFSSMQTLYENHQNLKICEALESTVDLSTFCITLSFRNETNSCCPDNCGDDCVILEQNYFAWNDPGIGRPLAFMLIQGVVYFTILFFSESGTARRLLQAAISGSRAAAAGPEVEDDTVPLNSLAHVVEDTDVATERERIMKTPLDELKQTESLILMDVLKYYGPFLAVNKLSLGIPQGECFGLLGVNGAGKTTTFKMLTGDETMSGGHAYIEGSSVKSNIKQVQRLVGYCPQFDALIDQMTVRETLRMFARLRGVQEADIGSTIEQLVAGLLLQDHVDKQCQSLSGGNKRKLSTAIALVGEPPVVFLDEPTTGMDPVARRLLWDTLTRIRASGRTLILTSHSMEECEALCTRIAIMVNGQFKCLGSPQHLKHKFGDGYTLVAKLSGVTSEEIDQRTDQLVSFIETTFPGCTLKDLHQGLVHYQVPSQKMTWAQVFGTMERAKAQFSIEDYSVSQTTLEQVFINFARAQLPPHEEGITCSIKAKNCCRFFCCCGCCKVK